MTPTKRLTTLAGGERYRLEPRRYRIPSRAGYCHECGGYAARLGGRGLCRVCYQDPLIRREYPLGSYEGLSVQNREPPSPEAPTDTLPGSEERILVYQERAAAGRHIRHPEDRVLERAPDVVFQN